MAVFFTFRRYLLLIRCDRVQCITRKAIGVVVALAVSRLNAGLLKPFNAER